MRISHYTRYNEKAKRYYDKRTGRFISKKETEIRLRKSDKQRKRWNEVW